MDQLVVPPLTAWQILVDGVPTFVALQGWIDSVTFDLRYIGAPPVVAGYVKLLFKDVGLRTVTGSLARAPQTVQFFP